MSMIHYIGTSRELPIGEFGSVKSQVKDSNTKTKEIKFTNNEGYPDYIALDEIVDLSDIKDGEVEVYGTHEDAAGIFVQTIDPGSEKVKKHFKNQFVYQVSANWGKFLINEELKEMDIEMYKANRKCILELFEYLRHNAMENEEFEIYTYWIGEEDEGKNTNLSRKIDLKTYKIEDDFMLKDKEYILIKC